MSQSFYKGRTNNHLTWVMVDSTDFATPESALSAATKIKIYGKVRGATGVNFVSSGAGSLTNDIQHVGASALGIYTIALAKADLSDASNAWYDQYIISLSATGAAYQTLIVDGGIDASALSALQSRISDVQSYLAAMSSVQSDIYSGVVALSDAASNAYSAAVVGASRILLVQSRLSDFDSRLVSDVSDILSQLTVIQSMASDAHSAATAGASRALINQSRISDVQSFLSDFQSDLLSHIDTTGVQLNASTMSDLRSAINAITVTIGASDVSDIASAVVAALTFGSTISDIYSLLSDLQSDFQSRVPKRVATDSQLSDLMSDAVSDLKSFIGAGVELGASTLSDIRSAIAATELDASDLSDIASAVAVALSDSFSDVKSAVAVGNSRILVAQSLASDAVSAVGVANSRLLVNQSTASDIYSLLSDLHSDVGVMSGVVSDVYSALGAGVEIGASSMSDLRSAVTANGLQAAGADPTAVIGVTASYGAKIDFLGALARNKLTQTSTEQTLYRDDGTTVTASATCSDDGTTATRGEFQ